MTVIDAPITVYTALEYLAEFEPHTHSMYVAEDARTLSGIVGADNEAALSFCQRNALPVILHKVRRKVQAPLAAWDWVYRLP